MKRYFGILKTLLKIDCNKFLVFQMFASCILYNLSNLLPPIATAGIIKVITESNFSNIWYYVGLYVIFYVLYYSLLRWNYKVYEKLDVYYQTNISKKLFNHVVDNDSILNKISKGKIVTTCSEDVRNLVDVVDTASESLVGLIKIIIILLIFARYNIITALIVLVLDGFYLILMSNNSKKISKYYDGQRKYEDRIIDTLSQMLNNIKKVKSLSLSSNLSKKIDKERASWEIQFRNKRKGMTNRYSLIPYIVDFGKIILYVLMAYLVIKGKMTLDRLVLLISYFEMIVTISDSMLEDLLNLDNYGIRVNRINNILKFNNTSVNMVFGNVDNDYITGSIVFDNVYYEIKNTPILTNVSFKVYPNEITAIVGHSGSGKTTILNLLYRLDRVKSGSITIDNESIYNYTKKVYSSNVSGVFQKPFVFEMSIRDNLSLIDKNKDNQIKACKRVGIHEFIENLPKGYNTIIREEDNILTEGQKQLLAIARSLLSKAEILLFDEVTSNVDNEETMQIKDVLEDLKIDHTILLVTHKPEIMEIADKIIVIDNGRVSCKGTNHEVYDKSKLYRSLRNRATVSVSKD